MRLVTLNVWNRDGDWPARAAVLADGLRQLRPDLVTLQESVVLDGYDQVAELLDPGYTIFHQVGRTPDGVGASIASRWPIVRVHERALHVTPRVDPIWIGSVAVAEIDAPEPVGPLLLVHHKPSYQYGFEYERELQAVAAARYIESVREEHHRHVLVAGDFDAEPHAASIRFWTGRQSLDGTSVCYRDAWESTHPDEPGYTFDPRNPLVNTGEMTMELGRRIDYILVRSGPHRPTLTIDHCDRIFAEPVDGVWASDHFGLVADLTAS
ncbi:endonuclease/exonuclease/phosphatase family protein [Actinomycetes bacterium KLBMP 9797]